MKMKNIYYDETLHHRKIGFNDKRLRFDELTQYFFMFAFLEINDDVLKKIKVIEDDFKARRKIPVEKELKSEHLIRKNLMNIDKEQKEFLLSLFGFLENEGSIFSLSYIPKSNPLFQFIFAPKYMEKFGFTSKPFLYSIQKYLSVRRLSDLHKLISKELKVKTIYKVISKWLIQDSSATPRNDEKSVFLNLSKAFTIMASVDRRVWTIDRLKWDYREIPISLAKILDERHQDNVNLFFDSFKEIEDMWSDVQKVHQKNWNFNAFPVHSKTNLGTRVVDWYLGFMRKLILALVDPSTKSRSVYGETYFVDEEVIDFMNENKELFKSFRRVMASDYWSTFTTGYSDDFVIAISALNLILSNDEIDINLLKHYYKSKIDKMTI